MSELHDVLAVIPARYGSSRFPGKPLAPIRGVPLVLRVYDRVTAAIPPAQIIVATDDARIRDVCEAAGARVAMTSRHCITGTDRVWEAVRDEPAGMIVNVQGDEPLIAAQDILTVIRTKQRQPDRVANAMCRIADPSDISSATVPKVVTREDGRLAYMSRSPVPFLKTAGLDVTYRRQVCIYAFNREELRRFAELGMQSPLERPEDIEVLRFLDLGIDVQMVEVGGASLAVDVPGDVARVEAALAQ